MTEQPVGRRWGMAHPQAQTRRWLVAVVVGLGLACLLVGLSGCADASYWWARTSMGLDCRPEVIKQHQGHCVAVAKGH